MAVYRLGEEGENRFFIEDAPIAVEREIKYASAWFAEHNSKPPLVVVPGTDVINPGIRRTVENQLLLGTLDQRTVVAFLVQEFRAKPVVCGELWTSFGQRIGEANQNITIVDLFQLAENEQPAAYVEAADVQD